MIELKPQSYDEWKRERQAYLDARSAAQIALDVQYQEFNRNDAYYNTLSDRIRQRQLAAIPVAGQGLLQFLDTTGRIAKGVGFVFPIARKLALLTELTKELVTERLT